MTKNKWIKIRFKDLKGTTFKYNNELWELVGKHAAVSIVYINYLNYEFFNDSDIIEVIDRFNEYKDVNIVK